LPNMLNARSRQEFIRFIYGASIHGQDETTVLRVTYSNTGGE